MILKAFPNFRNSWEDLWPDYDDKKLDGCCPKTIKDIKDVVRCFFCMRCDLLFKNVAMLMKKNDDKATGCCPILAGKLPRARLVHYPG